MKKRIKIDSAIVSLFIIVTGVLYVNKDIYLTSQTADDVLDFIGVLLILKGVLYRMAGRGYKKSLSQKSEALVTDGLYQYVRNPMYLGSFYIGAGFVLTVWPWWTIPLFAYLFYARFKIQVEKEEAFLLKKFGQDYEDYCQKTPRIFPKPDIFKSINPREIFPPEIIFSTKEKRGLWIWPLLAILLEACQEYLVFHQLNWGKMLCIWFSGVLFFGIWSYFFYAYYNKK